MAWVIVWRAAGRTWYLDRDPTDGGLDSPAAAVWDEYPAAGHLVFDTTEEAARALELLRFGWRRGVPCSAAIEWFAEEEDDAPVPPRPAQPREQGPGLALRPAGQVPAM